MSNQINHPFRNKILDAQKNIPTPTYKKMHEMLLKTDFNFEEYLSKFNWENIPNNAEYKSSLKLLQTANDSTEIYIKQLNDELSIFIHNLCNNFLNFTVYDAALMKQPKGSLSLNHVDQHGNFRKRYGLIDKIKPDEIYNKIQRYWMSCTDRKHGQYFEVNGIPLDWKAGELYKFSANFPHCGGTLAEEPRIFIVITGTNLNH